MISRDRLLAEYVESRLDTYETRPCRYSADYVPWAWICGLSGGATEECVDVADEGDKIMDEARRLATESCPVRERVYLLLVERKERGVATA